MFADAFWYYGEVMNTLYLTQQEKKTFDAWSNDLRNGWQVTAERDIPADTPAKLQMRLQLMHLRSPSLKSLAQGILPSMAPADVQKLLSAASLKDASDADLAELTFAMGASGLTNVIAAMLATAKTDAELEQLAILTTLRHQLLS